MLALAFQVDVGHMRRGDCQQCSAENGRVEYGDGNGSKFRDNPIVALVESYTNHDLVCGGTGPWLALGPSSC